VGAANFSEAEKLILEYLYVHPEGKPSTSDLVHVLHPDEMSTQEQEHSAYKETQRVVENLLAAGLMKGERHSGFGEGNVYHAKIYLTNKGEAEAIKQRRLNEKMRLSDADREAAQKIAEKMKRFDSEPKV